jgi:2-phospho-L-lactate guanylyltransferase (CobY/MobA/RfbA family)
MLYTQWNVIQPLMKARMNPKDTVSEISQTQKDKDCMICVIHGIGTNYLYRETVEQ